jgi:hypothetical protein
MSKYAVIENDMVVNVVVADSKGVAEQITGETCVLYTDENPAIIGLSYVNGVFEQLPIPEPLEHDPNFVPPTE